MRSVGESVKMARGCEQIPVTAALLQRQAADQ